MAVLLLGGCGGSSSQTVVAKPRETRIVYRAIPIDPHASLGPTIDRATNIIRRRLALVVEGALVTRVGDTIVVDVPRSQPAARVEKIAGATARLAFFDWEADVLTPSGKTVASRLRGQDATALALSQGGTGGPGVAGAGGASLYDAIRLASTQPAESSSDNSRVGAEYYVFGAPTSAACATAAKDRGKSPTVGVHCLLSGPAVSMRDLVSGLPAGVQISQGQVLVVKPGAIVLQASDPSATQTIEFTDPTAGFYVLRDHAALLGREIANPLQSTDSAGNPDVAFYFSGNGESKFQAVTRTIARRGKLDSGLGQTFNQHFAIALDRKLLTVAQIDFNQYPDGIPAARGADVTGGFTVQSAQDLATLLRLGELPVTLELVSATPP